MKTKLFGKTAALVMGSLMIVSGQTLAMESNKQEVTNAEALGEVEVLIAQEETATVDDQQKEITVDAIVAAQTDVGDAISKLTTDVKGGPGQNTALNLLSAANSLVGDAKALVDANVVTGKDADLSANLLAQAETLVGNAESAVNLIAQVDPNAKAALSAVSLAKSTVGDAEAAADILVTTADDTNS